MENIEIIYVRKKKHVTKPLDKLKIFLIPIKLNGIYYYDGDCDIMNMDMMMMMMMIMIMIIIIIIIITITNSVYPLQTQQLLCLEWIYSVILLLLLKTQRG